MIYLDHAASTPLGDSAREVLQHSFKSFANPSSIHGLGLEVKQKLEQARERLFNLVDAKKTYDCVFTSSATESNNTVIFGLHLAQGDVVHYHPYCHPSQVSPLFELEKKGVILKPLPSKNGSLLSDIELDEKSKLVLLSHVNNQTGIITDIEGIASIIKNKNSKTHIHIDASQSFTKLPLSLKNNVFDSITLSSHKLGGPKGVSTLFLKKYSVQPLIFGGGHEGGLRSSTVNYPLIEAYVTQSEHNISHRGKYFDHVSSLKLQCVNGLKQIKQFRTLVHGHSSPYVLCFALEGVDNRSFAQQLSEKSVYISTSSACSSNRDKITEKDYFNALDFPEPLHDSVLRVSFGFSTTLDEINQFIHCCRDLLK